MFDHAGNYLYVTTSDGLVRRYNLAHHKFDATYTLGGSLNGTDIAPDDSFLLATQTNTGVSGGVIHRLDLKTGAVTNITYPLTFGEQASWDVAITSNGLALFTFGHGSAPVRQIDLATNTVTNRTDAVTGGINGAVTDNTRIARSADGSRLYFTEGNDSGGPVFTYAAGTNTFGPPAFGYVFLDYVGAGVNRNGTLLGTRLQWRITLDSAPDLHFVHSFDGSSDTFFEGAVAFDAVRDTMYAVNTNSEQIVAYDTNSFGEQLRMTIGENIGFWVTPFDTGTLVASHDGRFLALETPSGIRLFSIPATLPPPSPPPPPTPSLAVRQDMVFDHIGRFLYMSTYTGWVQRYNISTGQLDVIANPGGGSLNGIDIATDDSFLLVAQDDIGIAEGRFLKINLSNNAVTNIPYRLNPPEAGGWDVKIASNALAFVTTQFNGEGNIQLRQINLSDNTVTARTDAPSNYSDGYVTADTRICRSADRTRLYFLEPNSSDGPAFTYDAGTDTFGPWTHANRTLSNASAAVSRNGALLATRIDFNTSIDTASNFAYVSGGKNIDSGLAFDPLKDIVYGVDSTTDEIIAFDSNLFTEKFRFPIGLDVSPSESQFYWGTLIASDDGRYLALALGSGVQILTIPTTPTLSAPVFTEPRAMVFDHQGKYLYLTTDGGLVWPYNLATQQLETPYAVGGSLFGADIAPDDSFLLVADGIRGLRQAGFREINLASRAVSNINYDFDFTERGGWDVAIAANGLALVTTQAEDSGGIGFTPLRQIDLATKSISKRADAPTLFLNQAVISEYTRIQRSADGTRLYFLESNQGTGPAFTYSATTNLFSPSIQRAPSGGFTFLQNGSGAVSRDGSLLGTRLQNAASAFIDTASTFTLQQTLNGLDSGVAFDATKDILYGVNSSADQIVAYDTGTFAEKFRMNIGEDVVAGSNLFGPGTLVSSPDGNYLALMTQTAIRIFDVEGTASPVTITPAPKPTPTPFPTPTPTPTPTATPIVSVAAGAAETSEGGSNAFVISASSNTVRPVTINYSMGGKATFGVDYTTYGGFGSTGQVTIPVGQNSVSIGLAIVLDNRKEKAETVTMTLNPGSGYSFGTPMGTKKAKKQKLPSASFLIGPSS